jgi:hypothetical protein
MAEHIRWCNTRRDFLTQAFCGFGSVAFSSMLWQEKLRAAGTAAANPLAPKPPHFEPKAKSVIFLFMAGGPSHLETFDPKPLLNELHGQPRPKEFGEAKYQFVSPTRRSWVPSGPSRSTARAASTYPICFPISAKSWTIWPSSARAGATWWFTRRRSISFFRAAFCLASRAWARGPSMDWGTRAIRYRLTSLCPIQMARSKPASRCTCTDFCRRCTSRRCSAGTEAGAEPGSAKWRGSERPRKTVDLIHRLNEAAMAKEDDEFGRA